MVFHHRRKLMPEICESICKVEKNCSSNCEECLKLCITNPQYYYYSQPPPPIPPLPLDDTSDHGKSHALSPYLVLALSVIGAAFFVVICCAIFARIFRRRRRSLSPPLSLRTQDNTRDDFFVDEEHGPVVDHPIWYIRTPGLQESIINAIAVCRYKRGEGLIEGTECSVCLSEFQEDESVRLLPKCNHAFHLPCIDTWLRSHTNCPMCRAPIVSNNTLRVPSMQHHNHNLNVLDSTSSSGSSSGSGSGSLEMRSVENINNGRSLRGMENTQNIGFELRNREEDEEGEEQGQLGGERVLSMIRPRRSVSLDSSSVADIALAASAFVLSADSDSDSNRVLGDETESERIGSKRVNVNVNVNGNENENGASSSKGRGGGRGRSSSFRIRYLHSVVPSSMKRSRSFNGKYLVSSLYSRSQTQRKQNANNLRSF
ncbi:hypothetical protein HN51_030614 [Arachis hypogaea]|uniref:RING-type E3 ubiquitin transferase n=1 Tax=Arachis hypogaea TaxID=3818 RepID=A0A445BAM3_ARAHY|nr:RING-H2 finger protein ATL52 [Arachis hypogaea]QHO15123.1 RING-H2 finger protein [Arachis hypogaea]RYR35717.1 hypothetical protein Ahy_A10g050841 [Arachis hypogaea]